MRYLYEYEPLSTAGGLFHYRDTIQKGLKEEEPILFLNSDVCNLYKLDRLIQHHQRSGKIGTVLCVKSDNESSKSYGCLVISDDQQYGFGSII